MIINLTQHVATPSQLHVGVLDLLGAEHDELIKLLTFEDLPTYYEVARRAVRIAEIADKVFLRLSVTGMITLTTEQRAMIGGALWLMAPLERYLLARRIRPVYAFSKRAVREEIQEDGSKKKVSVFEHLGFVDVVAQL